MGGTVDTTWSARHDLGDLVADLFEYMVFPTGHERRAEPGSRARHGGANHRQRFSPSTTVLFWRFRASQVTYVSPTQLTATPPAHVLGLPTSRW